MIPIIVALMAFVSNGMGDSSWTVARFDTMENCEAAKAVWEEQFKSSYSVRKYACIRGVQ